LSRTCDRFDDEPRAQYRFYQLGPLSSLDTSDEKWPQLSHGQRRKPVWRDSRTPEGLPQLCAGNGLTEFEARGSLLACMTASREPSNQSFEFDREAAVCSGNRRYFFIVPYAIDLKNTFLQLVQHSDQYRDVPLVIPVAFSAR